MLKLELENSLSEKIQDGITREEISSLHSKLLEVKKKFLADDLGFKKLPYQSEELIQDFKRLEKKMVGMNTIVVLGIGGSNLGARAIHSALNGEYYNERNPQKKIYFAGDTTDPEAINELVNLVDLKTTIFLVISKSGDTIEPVSVFVYFRNLVENALGAENVSNHFIFITDPEKGSLKELADERNIETISIPADVGGRFSVLSPAGLLPTFLTGYDVSKILDGAKDIDEMIKKIEIDSILEYVAIQYLYYRKGISISVLMPYQYSMFEFAKWYQQLFAESLGKKYDLQGKEVNEGLTPIAALGPIDQHSQLQLYNEGPNDKFITFLFAEESRSEIVMGSDLSTTPQFSYLAGKNFQNILRLELESTVHSLVVNNRATTLIKIQKIDGYYLGQLFYFFEVVVSLLGYMLEINPFDQPGVELSKKTLYAKLGKE